MDINTTHIRLRLNDAQSGKIVFFVFTVLCGFFLQSAQTANSASLCDPNGENESVNLSNTFDLYQAQRNERNILSSLKYFGHNDTIVTMQASLFTRFPGTEQTVRPVPKEEVIVGGKIVERKIEKSKVATCMASINRLQGLDPVVGSRDYACALLSLDKNCLEKDGEQPNVPNPSIPKRSIIIMSREGVAFCTGIFLNKNTIATARHCFIDQETGSIKTEFTKAAGLKFDINSLDMKRSAVVDIAAIRNLSLPSGFDIDKDPVKISVITTELQGALALPEVVLKAPVPDQLMWVAGPFALLDQAIAMQSAALHPEQPPPTVKWEDSIRWSDQDSAQCRVKAISKDCIYHTCQTSVGFSGSPMIVSAYSLGSKSTIEIIGIHSGTTGSTGGWSACAKDTSEFKASTFSAYNVGKNGGF